MGGKLNAIKAGRGGADAEAELRTQVCKLEDGTTPHHHRESRSPSHSLGVSLTTPPLMPKVTLPPNCLPIIITPSSDSKPARAACEFHPPLEPAAVPSTAPASAEQAAVEVEEGEESARRGCRSWR